MDEGEDQRDAFEVYECKRMYSKILAKMHWLGMYICNAFSSVRNRKSNFFCFAF